MFTLKPIENDVFISFCCKICKNPDTCFLFVYFMVYVVTHVFENVQLSHAWIQPDRGLFIFAAHILTYIPINNFLLFSEHFVQSFVTLKWHQSLPKYYGHFVYLFLTSRTERNQYTRRYIYSTIYKFEIKTNVHSNKFVI